MRCWTTSISLVIMRRDQLAGGGGGTWRGWANKQKAAVNNQQWQPQCGRRQVDRCIQTVTSSFNKSEGWRMMHTHWQHTHWLVCRGVCSDSAVHHGCSRVSLGGRLVGPVKSAASLGLINFPGSPWWLSRLKYGSTQLRSLTFLEQMNRFSLSLVWCLFDIYCILLFTHIVQIQMFL